MPVSPDGRAPEGIVTGSKYLFPWLINRLVAGGCRAAASELPRKADPKLGVLVLSNNRDLDARWTGRAWRREGHELYLRNPF
jgi:hypothetical protein